MSIPDEAVPSGTHFTSCGYQDGRVCTCDRTSARIQAEREPRPLDAMTTRVFDGTNWVSIPGPLEIAQRLAALEARLDRLEAAREAEAKAARDQSDRT